MAVGTTRPEGAGGDMAFDEVRHSVVVRDGQKYIEMYSDTKYRYWVSKCIEIQNINTGLRNVFEIQIRILYLKYMKYIF